MNITKSMIKEFGYKCFKTVSIKKDPVKFIEIAMKDDEEYIVFAQLLEKTNIMNSLLLNSIPSSIRFVILNSESIFKRDSENMFIKCYSIPKADGTQWGEHTKRDLIPVKSIRQIIEYIKKGLVPEQYEALAFILSFKILDEFSDDEVVFKFNGNISYTQGKLNKIASVFGLKDEWEKYSTDINENLHKAVMNIQPYSFISDVQTNGIFGVINNLISSEHGGHKISIPGKINPVILSLLAGKSGAVHIDGQSALNLLDIGIIGSKSIRVISNCHPLIKNLGEKCIEDFKVIADELTTIEEYEDYQILISVPPFGKKITKTQKNKPVKSVSNTKKKMPKSVDTELYWLEVCYNLLKEGGYLIVFLSEGFLSNVSLAYAREWVLNHFQIETIISLPNTFFYPHSGIKTNLLCLRKISLPPDDYNVFMAEVEEEDFDNISSLIRSYRDFKEGNSV
ncbi:SAM-dependent methyltransferase [Desulfonema limicola]|uniref:SAM-dependent methyltransferase n=1 Tax=Desulfonema limicola TaxID=45656 RepID=A0A975B430_9BACT|nr:N-6 DNA methylase [Desulfonema limicola]QTA78430.1 SAM-dependent methyltransferase [Desulfonema limicola]